MGRTIGLLLASVRLFAQEVAPRQESLVVTGTYEPIPLEEADRNVRSLDIKSLQLTTNTFADLFKLDSSLDLRQRAGNGLQGDLSIRGGGFGQTLVLLDGMRLNDVQSGHHNLDVPVPLESLGRVEVLKGSGSTFYGSDAVGGVVNFITRPAETTQIRLRTAAGNFGVNQQRGIVSYAKGPFAQQLSFSRDFSSGFMPNRDYRNLSLASITRLSSSLGHTDITLSNNDRPFGAEQFYGNYNSWERTRTWFASVRQSLGSKTVASLAFRRHTDLFVLYRDRPGAFTNRHAVESLQASLRRREDFGQNIKLHYGIEGYRDTIDSNNLGIHDRARGAGYAALDVRALKRFSFSLGTRDEVWGSGNHEISPSVSAGVWLWPTLKLRGSASRAFRLPTYTDLYYHDPANLGSPGLRPERAWSYEAGATWNPNGKLRVEGTVFQRRERDGIDYVKPSAADIWRAANFQRIHFTGFEGVVGLRVLQTQEVEVSYTALRGAQDTLEGLLSKYLFNYPVHQGVVSWQAAFSKGLLVRSRLGALQRFNREPYAVWDIYGASGRGRIRPFIQLTNMTATRYEEIPGVVMPPRAFVCGLELLVSKADNGRSSSGRPSW